MAITDYTPRLRQWWINTRWPHAAEGLGEVWAMNFVPDEDAQWDLPLFTPLDTYVLFGDPLAHPTYARRVELNYQGADGLAAIGRFVEGCDALEVAVYARNNFDLPLVRQRVESPTEIEVTALRMLSTFVDDDLVNDVLADNPAKAYALPFTLDSTLLRQLAAAARAEPAANAAAAAIDATLTLAWERGGFSGRTAPIDIRLVA